MNKKLHRYLSLVLPPPIFPQGCACVCARAGTFHLSPVQKSPLRQGCACEPLPLLFLHGELVDPAEFGVAVLAGDVPHHVTTGEHLALLDLTVDSHQSPVSSRQSPGHHSSTSAVASRQSISNTAKASQAQTPRNTDQQAFTVSNRT